MKCLPTRLNLALIVCGSAQAILAADKADTPEIIRGPFFSGTIKANFPRANLAIKGIVVTLGQEKKACVCYDTDLLRLSIGWTGDFLEFGNGQVRIEHPQPPSVKGAPVFGTKPGPGWAKGNDFADPRPQHQGPLPKDWAHYRGLYVHGNDVIVSYTVGNTSVLELPGVQYADNRAFFTRTLNVSPSKIPLSLLACYCPQETGQPTPAIRVHDGKVNFIAVGGSNRFVVGLLGEPKDTTMEIVGDQLWIRLPASSKPTRLKLVIGQTSDDAELTQFRGVLAVESRPVDLAPLCKGGPPHWTEPVVTQGVVGTGEGPYVVDTLPEPLPNPWNAKTFFGGFDFLPDGRAAICAFHGDVWIVSGIDDKLEKLTWKRFATGMFQPLGLKVVNGKIHVTGRDQITRLHDLNNDGEADFYENFNNDCVVTANYHEFCMDLDTDSRGNFYCAKGSPWPPNVDSPHQGTMLKISKDGSRMEVFATGLRAPNGLAVGPHDEVTVSDNQGHWMPSSKLNLVKPGGFYGMMPAAQHELTVRRSGANLTLNPSDPRARAALQVPAFDPPAPIPTSYDQPLCWLPMNMDNSSGGQAWVTSDQWGPFKNHLLFMSYGKCTLFHVMTEEVDGMTQAGMVRFPFKFSSGVMRARFNPRDGQLYLCGLRGWQTDGVRDGGFYRVRFTDKAVHMPLDLHATTRGLYITFTSPLDPASAADSANWSVEQWNYLWTGGYGSPDISAVDPNKRSHDPVSIKSVQLSADKKTVFLELPDIRPVMQMKIKYSLKAEDGAPVAQEIYNTIHRLGADKKLSLK